MPMVLPARPLTCSLRLRVAGYQGFHCFPSIF